MARSQADRQPTGIQQAKNGPEGRRRAAGIYGAIALLTFHGWSAAQAAQLRGWQLAGSTAVAAGLGLVMVALKYLLLLHLH